MIHSRSALKRLIFNLNFSYKKEKKIIFKKKAKEKGEQLVYNDHADAVQEFQMSRKEKRIIVESLVAITIMFHKENERFS